MRVFKFQMLISLHLYQKMCLKFLVNVITKRRWMVVWEQARLAIKIHSNNYFTWMTSLPIKQVSIALDWQAKSTSWLSGSLLFCPECGTLLDQPKDGDDSVSCEQCHHEEPANCRWSSCTRLALVLHLHGSFNIPWAAYDNIVITTRSHPDAFPSALRQKRKTQTKQHDKGDQGTLVVHPPIDTLPMLTTT